MSIKTKTFQIVKKGRVYYEATTGGYKCKIRITPAAPDLEPGEHTLVVEDESVRSKYGTSLVYRPVGADTGAKVFLRARYNKQLVEACKNLGGIWDEAEKVWAFPEFVAAEVEALDEIYNSAPVVIEITALGQEHYPDVGPIGYKQSVSFNGYPIASAYGRDSGAKCADGVVMLEGSIKSGGSAANWETRVAPGSRFRLAIPSKVLENLTEKRFSVKILGESDEAE